MTIRQTLRRHLAIVGVLVIVVGLVAASDTLHDRMEAFVFWAESAISQSPRFGMFMFVLLAMISAMVAFFSSAVLTPIAIYTWGSGTCLVLLWLGWFLGGIVSFSIGKFLGRSVVSIIIGEEMIVYWANQLNERASFVHILLFQAVVPSEIPGYVLGTLRYPFVMYLTALGITEVPYAVATVYLGESFLNGESTTLLVLGFAIVVVAAFLWAQVRRRSASRSLRLKG